MAEKRQARPRERLSAYLRQQYPGPGREKRLAQDLQTTPRAARNMLEDHWPGDETWAALVRRFGQDVLRAVFAPEIAPLLAELTEKEDQLARELETLRARRRKVQGVVEARSYLLDGDTAEAPAARHELERSEPSEAAR